METKLELFHGTIEATIFNATPCAPLSRLLFAVDDLYLLIGSANVNQRSMDGQRDTEIAIGCYQSQDAYSNNEAMNRGEIHAYRMSLWYEHSRCAEDWLTEPESLERVRKMRSIGDRMWKIYRGEEIVDMEGVHLVSDPLKVMHEGLVEEVNECEGRFPDRVSSEGKRSKVLPPVSTT